MLRRRGRVLIVDDDQVWLEALTEFLVEEGYLVTSAPNGRAALEELSQFEPVFIITDVEMPIMDGRQLLERIRKQNERIPVIVVSGEQFVRPDGDGFVGAFRVIRKPVLIGALLSAIADASAHRARHQALQKRWLAAKTSRARAGRFFASAAPAFRRLFLTASAVSVVLLVVFASSLAVLNYGRGPR